jgi:hypothetical protein
VRADALGHAHECRAIDLDAMRVAADVAALCTGEMNPAIRLVDAVKREPLRPADFARPAAGAGGRNAAPRIIRLRSIRICAAGGGVCAFCVDRLQPIVSPKASREITASHGPAIVISASGMATGGRVSHQLSACLPDARNTVLFVGFQAEGTRGRYLVEGAQRSKFTGKSSRYQRESNVSTACPRMPM